MFLIVHGAIQTAATACLSGPSRLVGLELHFASLPWAVWGLALTPLIAHSVATTRSILSQRSRGKDPARSQPLQTCVACSGIGALCFIVFHIVEMGRAGSPSHPSVAPIRSLLAADLSSTVIGVPLCGLVYFAGTACACFFIFGRWTFGGGLSSEPQRFPERALRRCAAAVGILLWLLFANVIIFYATGAAWLGAPSSAVPAPACTA
jgi:succinate dehydrogenase / fumarate reductase cytochrome b subunit